MIDFCPLCSSTRNTYFKKYVSVVHPTTDRTRTLNSSPFQSKLNSIFYSFHVLTFLLPRKKGRNPDMLHRRHGNPSFSSTLGSWWTTVNSAQSYSTTGATEIQIRPGGVTRKRRKKKYPHIIQSLDTHTGRKRDQREKGKLPCLFSRSTSGFLSESLTWVSSLFSSWTQPCSSWPEVPWVSYRLELSSSAPVLSSLPDHTASLPTLPSWLSSSSR